MKLKHQNLKGHSIKRKWLTMILFGVLMSLLLVAQVHAGLDLSLELQNSPGEVKDSKSLNINVTLKNSSNSTEHLKSPFLAGLMFQSCETPYDGPYGPNYSPHHNYDITFLAPQDFFNTIDLAPGKSVRLPFVALKPTSSILPGSYSICNAALQFGYDGLFARSTNSYDWSVLPDANSHVAFVKVAVDLDTASAWDLMSGHAWIEITDLATDHIDTWGTWRDSLFGGSLYPDEELGRITGAEATRSMFVTQKQLDLLLKVIDKYRKKGGSGWSFLNNCTAFAKDAWKSVSGEKINTYFIEDLGFPRPIWPNPISAMYWIIDKNDGTSDRTINQCDSPYCDSPCPAPAIFCER